MLKGFCGAEPELLEAALPLAGDLNMFGSTFTVDLKMSGTTFAGDLAFTAGFAGDLAGDGQTAFKGYIKTLKQQLNLAKSVQEIYLNWT